MPLSERHESLIHELFDVNERVCAALDAGSLDALDGLAAENQRITAALATETLPSRSDPQSQDRLKEVVGRIRETRSRLEQRREELAEQLHTLNTRRKVHRVYGSRR
jgi:hypothetical protein